MTRGTRLLQLFWEHQIETTALWKSLSTFLIILVGIKKETYILNTNPDDHLCHRGFALLRRGRFWSGLAVANGQYSDSQEDRGQCPRRERDQTVGHTGPEADLLDRIGCVDVDRQDGGSYECPNHECDQADHGLDVHRLWSSVFH